MQFPVDQQTMVGLKEAQRILNLGRRSVHDLIKSGTLPAEKVGKKWQIQRKDLIEWIEKNQTDCQISDFFLQETTETKHQFLSDWT